LLLAKSSNAFYLKKSISVIIGRAGVREQAASLRSNAVVAAQLQRWAAQIKIIFGEP
jgi:hypothetical protein